MKIKGLEARTADELNFELQRGARFVYFEYCLSALVVTLKRSSDIYFIRQGEGTLGKSLPYTLLSLLFGWWGIPWGPIYTIGSLITNFRGGKDVTLEVIAAVNAEDAAAT